MIMTAQLVNVMVDWILAGRPDFESRQGRDFYLRYDVEIAPTA
jgi:hypothetical protein